jgi:hypothetical protein
VALACDRCQGPVCVNLCCPLGHVFVPNPAFSELEYDDGGGINITGMNITTMSLIAAIVSSKLPYRSTVVSTQQCGGSRQFLSECKFS